MSHLLLGILLIVMAVLVWRRLAGARPLPGQPRGVKRSAWEELLRLCHGDAGQAERLLSYERERKPGLGPDQACRNAVWRLLRDR